MIGPVGEDVAVDEVVVPVPDTLEELPATELVTDELTVWLVDVGAKLLLLVEAGIVPLSA